MNLLKSGRSGLRRHHYAVFAALCVVNSTANASIIHHESIDGDITITPPTTFLLGAGQQSIIGNSRFHLPKTSDFDDFIFEIPEGLVLNSIEYQENLAESVSDNLTIRFEIRSINQDGHPLAGATLASRSADLHIGQRHILFDMPWQAGRYAFVGAEYQRGFNPLSWDYTINFNLSPSAAVNAPGMLTLLLTAGLAFGIRRRQTSV